MRMWSLCLSVVAAAATTAISHAAFFTWTGAVDTSWSVCDNWTYTGPPPAQCYPSNTLDDASIPSSIGSWGIKLITVGPIDRLDMFANVNFTSSGSNTLSVQLFKIDATSSATDLAVAISGGARIGTVPP